MTIAEYEVGVAELERKLARIAELRAAIKAQRGEMAPEQIQGFAFNDLRSQPTDVTAVTPGPETVQGVGLQRQKLGEEQFAAMTDPSLQPTMTGQPSHDVDEITNQVNRILARGQGGDVPAEATATRQIQTPEFEAAMAPERPDMGPVEKPVMESVDEAIKAGGAALAQSVTMGAITLSQRDQKAIESSPIAATVGSLIGDLPGIVGAIGGARLTLAGFKRLAPSLIKDWFAGGEEVGKVLVNAAAREGLGGAYWSALRQTVEETVNPEEQRDWNDRLTQLATDVGMFAIGGAAFEGVGAGMGRGKRPTEVGPTEVKPTEVAPAERATAKEVLETVSPVREAEAARAEAVRRPGPKSTEEALGVRPTASGGAPKPQATAEQLQELADRFPTGKRAKELDKNKTVADIETGAKDAESVRRHDREPNTEGVLKTGSNQPSRRQISGRNLSVTAEYEPHGFDGRRIQRPEARVVETSDGENFQAIIADVTGRHPFGKQVTVPDPKTLKSTLDEGGRAYVSADGKAGLVVKADGEIAHVFNDPNINSIADAERIEGLMTHATSSGGKWLEAFDTYLPGTYGRAGFKPVARIRFDPKQAPAGWDSKFYQKYNNGQPDVVFMAYDGVRRTPRETAAVLKSLGYEDSYQAARAKTLSEISTPPTIEVAPAFRPKRFDYAAREVNGKPVFGQVTSEVDEAGMVTFKPRKGKEIKVKAEELREPTSVPRQRDDIEQVLEAAENQRRVAEEGRAEPTAGGGAPATTGKSKLAEQVEAVIDDAAPVGGPEVGTKAIKPVGQKVREVADKFEAEAKARISKRHKDIGGTAFDIGGATKLAAEELADYAIIGAAKIAKGAVELADFTKAMIEEYGEKIKPFIEDIHKKAQEEFHALRAQAVVDQHIEYLKGISQPFEYRPKVLATPTASGGAPSFRTGYARLREIKQGLREKLTGEKLRGRALEEQYIDDELGAFTQEAWQAGAPVMRTKEGSLIPVFESKADAERIWEQVYGRAKARLDKVPRLGPDKETEITREARRLFLQEMVDRGVALRVKRSGVKLSPDVKRKTDLSLYIIVKSEIGAEKLKEALKGIDANDLIGRQAVLQRLAMERGLLSPAVRAQGTYVPLDFAAYGGFKDVAGETLDPTRMIQQIDGALSAEAKAAMPGGAGPAERNLLWRTRDMLIQKMNFIGDGEAMGKQAFVGIKSKAEKETISDILEAIAKDEGRLSVQGALAKSEVREITTDERLVRAALDVRKIYSQLLKMQNAARAQRSQRLIPERDFYSPRKHKEVAAWQELLGINADPANLMSTGTMIPDFVIPNKPSIGHDLQRLLLEPRYELEKDALVLLEKYMNAAARDIFDTSIIQNAKAFMDQLEGMGFGKSAVSLRDWVGQSFAGAPHGFDKKIGEALSSAFGDTVGKNWQGWSGKFRGALARSVFPLNFSWNLFLQTSSGVLTHTRYGTANSIKGAVRWFTDKGFREDIAENAYSYIVKTQRSGRISHQDFNTGMSRAVKLEKGPLETAADAANFLSEWIERHMTGWSVAAGYEDGLKKGLTGKALWEYASDAGAKTQSMYNKEDLPGLLRSSGVKTIAPFQTFAFEMWNTVREVIGKTGTPPATAQERAKMVLRFVAGATAVNMAFGAASGRKPWEIGSGIPFFPMLGQPIGSALVGETGQGKLERALPAPIGIAVAFGKAVEDVMTGDLTELKTWDKLIQWAIRYGTAIGGVPGGTQLNRIYAGIVADAQGGVLDKNGKLIFPITDTKDQIQAIFGGPWSTEAGREKIKSSERGVIEIARAKSTGGKVTQTITEALPIVGDVVEFRNRKEDEGGIDIVPGASRRSSRRRVRRR